LIGLKVLKEVYEAMKEQFGEGYFSQSGDVVETDFRGAFKEILRKYNNPASFDGLMKANQKVDLAKAKMAENLTMTLENTTALAVIFLVFKM
jgi:hypothetical protein